MFTRGKKCFSPALIVLYMPAKETTLGICVSKKHGTSVKRNRIKRLIREAFRSVCKDLSKPYCFVILPKQSEVYTLKAIRKSLCGILEREKFFS